MARVLRVAAFAITGLLAIGILAWEIESRLGPDFLTVTPNGNSSVAEARRFGEFPIYSVGRSFHGLNLNAVDHTMNRLEGETVELSFLYGTCDIRQWKGKADGGCGLPLVVQNWRACKQTLADLGTYGHIEQITVRGVPCRLYDGYRQLKLATRETTVVLQGQGRKGLLAAARSLRGVNNSVGLSEKLPKPARGALDGTLEC